MCSMTNDDQAYCPVLWLAKDYRVAGSRGSIWLLSGAAPGVELSGVLSIFTAPLAVLVVAPALLPPFSSELLGPA